MLRCLGTEVRMLERGKGLLLPQAEPEVGPTIAGVLEDEGIHLRVRTQARAVRQDGAEDVRVIASVAGRERTLRAERLLVATGRRPNTHEIGLEKAGVKTDADGWV